MSRPRAPFLQRSEFYGPTAHHVVLEAYDSLAEFGRDTQQVWVGLPLYWRDTPRELTLDGYTIPILIDATLPPNVVVIVGERDVVVIADVTP